MSKTTLDEEKKHSTFVLQVQKVFWERSSNESLQSVYRIIRDYNMCHLKLGMTQKQKAYFSIIGFSGSARDYFFENCKKTMTFEELVVVILKKYDSNALQ